MMAPFCAFFLLRSPPAGLSVRRGTEGATQAQHARRGSAEERAMMLHEAEGWEGEGLEPAGDDVGAVRERGAPEAADGRRALAGKDQEAGRGPGRIGALSSLR
jgi:hypothetical protein